MKRVFSILFAVLLLLFLFGCTGEEPALRDADTVLLTPEELLGSYDIFYQSDNENGSGTVDLRLLNDALTFASYPGMTLDSELSFDRYDPKTGKASLQSSFPSTNGEVVLSCTVTFTKTNKTISVSGYCRIKHEEGTEKTYTLSDEMSKKL